MYRYLKRVLDLVLSIFLLMILAIPMIIISICIKLDSEGPVFFKQDRTGKDGKVFKLYKFRTMVADNDVYDKKCEDRYTKIGAFLRKASIDELPQLINILKGEMSFIGPRPWITDYYDNMTESQRHRCDVLPGITGLAQVRGRNNLNVLGRIACDLEYIQNFSLLQDVKIVFLTIRAVFTKDGGEAATKSGIHNDIDILKQQSKNVSLKKESICQKRFSAKVQQNSQLNESS